MALIMLTLLIKSTERGLLKQFDWNNFFYFLIKTDFSRFWLNILYQKIKNFEKWEKMSFDSIFELAIVILVGLEYLIVKIGRKFWFLQLFFSGSFLLLYYRWKWPNFEKKDLFSEVATTIVVIFCKRPYRDTTCMP